jgi:hypothetical protein
MYARVYEDNPQSFKVAALSDLILESTADRGKLAIEGGADFRYTI